MALPRGGTVLPQNVPANPRRGGGNLRHLLLRRRTFSRLAGALASGVLLAASFPPLELDFLAWTALLPLLWIPVPATLGRRFAVGYFFGLCRYIPNLGWLNEVGFGAGWLLALVCAVYPMLWYVGIAGFSRAFAEGLDDARPQPSPGTLERPGLQCAFLLLSAVIWVGLEWVRSWMFTGFPWNLLGVSQWRRPILLRLTRITGVYGISFLIVAVNIAVCFCVLNWLRSSRKDARRRISLPLLLVLLLLAPVFWYGVRGSRLSPPDAVLRVLAVQGNIPQCRSWSQAQFEEARDVYVGLTRARVPADAPDLVVWPETAVPAPLGYAEYSRAIEGLMEDIRTPLLLGAVDYRPLPGARQTPTGWDPPAPVFNTAFLLGEAGGTVDSYDKIHRVPFGEFTPLGKHFPWLVKLIGMGRDLTPGTEFTVLDLPKGARAGINICFEDAFPYVSRAFVLRGANLLMTITNDAWYATSSGSRQHMIHAVFRAVESQRPLFRSGNNSDTCVILPNGRVKDLLYDEQTGNRFIRAARTYDVPLWNNPGTTFYTRHGDWFALLCGLGTLGAFAVLCGRELHRRAELHARVTGQDGGIGVKP